MSLFHNHLIGAENQTNEFGNIESARQVVEDGEYIEIPEDANLQDYMMRLMMRQPTPVRTSCFNMHSLFSQLVILQTFRELILPYNNRFLAIAVEHLIFC